jgi:hypothetical protein
MSMISDDDLPFDEWDEDDDELDGGAVLPDPGVEDEDVPVEDAIWDVDKPEVPAADPLDQEDDLDMEDFDPHPHIAGPDE